MFQLTAPSATGLHVNTRNTEGFSPLHLAAKHGHADLADLFLQRGAAVNVKTSTSQVAPLHVACKHNHMQVGAILRVF